jgi:uncharacterized protein (DUF305 family)
MDLAVGMDLAQPRRAQFALDFLRRMVGHHHDQAVDLRARLLDEVFVAAVRRIELADEETQAHQAPEGQVGSTRAGVGATTRRLQ